MPGLTNLLFFFAGCAVIAAISLLARPKFLLILILIFIYLLPRAGFLIVSGWYYFPIPIGYVLIVFIGMRWFFNFVVNIARKGHIGNLYLRGPFFLYCIIAIGAVSIGIIRGGHIPTIVLEFIFYFIAFFAFFMTIDTFEKKELAQLFMNGILICGFLVSLYGILLLIFGKGMLIDYITYNSGSYIALEGQFIGSKRTLSTYGDPNVLNAQLMVFCGVFTSLLLQGKYNISRRVLLFISLILTLVCIYFASSRASLIGLFMLLVIFAATRIKKLWLYIPSLVIGYFMLIEPVRKYYEHRIFTAGITGDMRITYIKIFFDLLMRHPLGVGFGNYVTEDYFVMPAHSVWCGFNSFYLHFFSRLGIQGLIVFILIFYLIIRYIFRGIGRIEDPNVKFFVFGAAWGIVAQQFNFLTNNVYQVPGGMLNFWIMCGMLTVIVNIYSGEKQKKT